MCFDRALHLFILVPLCYEGLALEVVSSRKQPTYNTGCNPVFAVEHTDKSKPLHLHIYDDLKVGYVEIHKTSSTTVMGYLKKIAQSIRGDSEKAGVVWSDLDDDRKKFIANNYKIFAIVRDPLQRFLSAASQIEAFYLMGWMEDSIVKHNITYWQQNCYPSGAEWDHDDDKNRGLWDSITVLQRAARVDGLLRDIKKNGYWDQHLFPMTSTLMHYESDDLLKGKIELILLDGTLEQSVASLFPFQIQNRLDVQNIHMGHNMASKTSERHWMLHPDELDQAASMGKFGQQIKQSIEDLYAVDRACINFGEKPSRLPAVTVPTTATEFDDLDFWLRTGPPSAAKVLTGLGPDR